MKTSTLNMDIIGCRNNCIYRAADKVEEEIATLPRKGTKYIARTVCQVCTNEKAKKANREMRQSIYADAEKAKESYYQSLEERGMKIDTAAIHRANNKWEEQADRWRNFQCPFFTVEVPQK